jgi:hypothetical protein
MRNMHDWSLISVHLDWQSAVVELRLTAPEGAAVLTATGVTNLAVPHDFPWGPSASVNGHDGPVPFGADLHQLKIEMQSGDVIAVTAKSFSMA